MYVERKDKSVLTDILEWSAAGKRKTMFRGIVLVVLFGLMLALNWLTPLISDDYRYLYSFADGERITAVSQIVPSQIAHYQTINGRVITHTLCQLFC
jgi:hypothetical protein